MAFINHINLSRNINDLKTNLRENNLFYEFVRLWLYSTIDYNRNLMYVNQRLNI